MRASTLVSSHQTYSKPAAMTTITNSPMHNHNVVPGHLIPSPHPTFLCRVFSALLLLASQETVNASRGDVLEHAAGLWDAYTSCNNGDQALSIDRLFVTFVYLGIEGGSWAPFATLYFSSSQESFDHSKMWNDSQPQSDSLLCMLASTVQFTY